MRLCPTVEGTAAPLITHRISSDVCQTRQCANFHKCHRCIYRGKAASWEPANPPISLMPMHDAEEPGIEVTEVDLGKPKKVAAVTEGLLTGDFEKAERAAHSLKGSSGNLGARMLQDVCEHLQISTRNHQLEESRRLAPELKAAFGEAEVALRRLLASYQN